FTFWGIGNIKEPRRAAAVPVMRGGPVVMLLWPVDPHGFGLLHVGRGALANPTLLIQRPGHVFVQDHIRRPTSLSIHRLRISWSHLLSKTGPLLQPVDRGWLAIDPAGINVECPGTVF